MRLQKVIKPVIAAFVTLCITVTSVCNPILAAYQSSNESLNKSIQESVNKPKVPFVPNLSSAITNNSKDRESVDQTPENKGGSNESLNQRVDKVKGKAVKEIIVRYRDQVGSDAGKSAVKEAVKSKLQIKKMDSKKVLLQGKAELLELDDTDDVSTVISELQKRPDVLYAQPNYQLSIDAVPPGDGKFSEQWNLYNNGQTIAGQAGQSGVDIDLLRAWDINTGNQNVLVGILDTGIDINHPEFYGRIYSNSDEIPNNGIDDDKNGFIDDVNSWDFANNDNTIYDGPALDAHGTHIAGIIAGSTNGTGISGINKNVTIVPLKFINGTIGYTDSAIAAIEYAKSLNVKIINCSFGSTQYNQALKDAMENSGILFCSAAGNSGNLTNVYPAAFDLPNNISVAAIDNRGQLASFSNYGSTVSMAAPGVNILSTLPDNTYGYMSGTSMAAPHLSGVGALLFAQDGSITPQKVKTTIEQNVTVLPSLNGKVRTSGMVNAYKALNAQATGAGNPSQQPVPTPSPVPNPTEEPGKFENHPFDFQSFLDTSNNIVTKFTVTDSVYFSYKSIHVNIGEDGKKIPVFSQDIGINTREIVINNIGSDRIYNFNVRVVSEDKTESYDGRLRINTKRSLETGKIEAVNAHVTKVAKSPFVITLDAVQTVNNNAPHILTVQNSVYSSVYNSVYGQGLIQEKNNVLRVGILATRYEFEPNGDFSLADILWSDDDMYGMIGAGGDEDFFKVIFAQDGNANFWLGNIPAGQDYDLYLYRYDDASASYRLISQSFNYGNTDELISGYPVKAGEWYYVKVNGYGGSFNNSSFYWLRAKNYPVPASEDSYEYNSFFDWATELTTMPQVIYANIHNAEDDDFYKFTVSSYTDITITLQDIPDTVDYDLVLYDVERNSVKRSNHGKGIDEQISISNLNEGTYYILVYPYQEEDFSNQNYKLSINCVPSDDTGNGTGLVGYYYDNEFLSDLKEIRTDARVNFAWDLNAPFSSMVEETFSVRWKGQIQPLYSEEYTFHTLTDDGVRLWVDGQLIIDKWINQGPTEYSGKINLLAGQKYNIKMEYYDYVGGATAKLMWSSNLQKKQVIPQSQLYPTYESGLAGLNAEYFNNKELTDLKVSRIESNVNFAWGGGSPDSLINNDGFSARWFGYIQPLYSELYTFYTSTDDGVRLWVNDQLLIDQWFDQGGEERSGSIYLNAGEKYRIVMEYYDNLYGASARLMWSSTSQQKGMVSEEQLYPLYPLNTPTDVTATGDTSGITIRWNQVDGADSYDVEKDGVIVKNITGVSCIITGEAGVPHKLRVRAKNASGVSHWGEEISGSVLPLSGSGTGLVGYYYNNENFTDQKLVRTDASIDFSWDLGSPDPSMVEETFSVRWKGQIQPLYSEEYTFHTLTDDGVRLWVDGQLLIDKWINQGATEYSRKINLVAGQKYNIKMEYYDYVGGATAKLMWSSSLQTKQVIPQSQLYPTYESGLAGLNAEYFNNRELTDLKVSRNESNINFAWGGESPDPLINNDGFSARWFGYIQPLYSEPYTFYTSTDDGVRLWVNDQLLIDQWFDQGGEERSGSIYLNAGEKYRIVMEYYDNLYGASARLMWSSTSQQKEIIPEDVLYPLFPLNTPTSLNAAGTNAEINVQWEQVAGADRYELEIDGTVINNGASTVYKHNVEPGISHVYRVRAGNAKGVSHWSESVEAAAIPQPGSGTGLTGYYYDSEFLTDLKLTRVDAKIDFNWDLNSPDETMVEETFSIRWKGQMQPLYTQEYTFYTVTDDGVRLWVNDQLLIDKWVNQGTAEHSGKISLVAGEKYNIKMEYYDYVGAASAKLSWSSNSQVKQVIPQSQLYTSWDLGVPKNIRTNSQTKAISLAWDAVEGATGYDIEVNGSGVIYNCVNAGFVHRDLLPGTIYTYRVRAKSSENMSSGWSSSVVERTLDNTVENIIKETTFGTNDDYQLKGSPVLSSPDSLIYMNLTGANGWLPVIFDSIGSKGVYSEQAGGNIDNALTSEYSDLGSYPYYVNRPEQEYDRIGQGNWRVVNNKYPSGIWEYSYNQGDKTLKSVTWVSNGVLYLICDTKKMNDLKYALTLRSTDGSRNFTGGYENSDGIGYIYSKDNTSGQWFVAACREMNEYEVKTSPVSAILGLDETKTYVQNQPFSFGIGKNGLGEDDRVVFCFSISMDKNSAVNAVKSGLGSWETSIASAENDWISFFNGIEQKWGGVSPELQVKGMLSLQQIRSQTFNGYMSSGIPFWPSNFIRDTSWVAYSLAKTGHDSSIKLSRELLLWFKDVNSFTNANSFTIDKKQREFTMNQTDSAATFLLSLGYVWSLGNFNAADLRGVMDTALNYVQTNYNAADRHVFARHAHDYWDDYVSEINPGIVKYESMVDVLWIAALEAIEPVYRSLGDTAKADFCRATAQGLRQGLEDYRDTLGGLYYAIKTDGNIYSSVEALPGTLYAAWLLNDTQCSSYIMNYSGKLRVNSSVPYPLTHSNSTSGALKEEIWSAYLPIVAIIAAREGDTSFADYLARQFPVGGFPEYTKITADGKLSYRTHAPSFLWVHGMNVLMVSELEKLQNNNQGNDKVNKYPLTWPATSNQVTLRFGQIDNLFAKGKGWHRGIDIQGNAGEEVKSAVNGQVVYKGYKEGYGNVIFVNSVYEGKKIQTRYAHLQSIPSNLSVGTIVTSDMTIGYMGNSGYTYGGYLLHFEVLESTDGNDCRLDESNTINRNPLMYVQIPGHIDYSYLSRPFAVGKVPGDTFILYTTAGTATVSTSVYGSAYSSEVGTMEIPDPDSETLPTDEQNDGYIKNLGVSEAESEVYLRPLVSSLGFAQYRASDVDEACIIVWNPDNQTATVSMLGKRLVYAVEDIYLPGETVIVAPQEYGRFVINRQQFMNYFFRDVGENHNEIVEAKKKLEFILSQYEGFATDLTNRYGSYDEELDTSYFNAIKRLFYVCHEYIYPSGGKYLQATYEALPESYRTKAAIHWVNMVYNGYSNYAFTQNLLPYDYYLGIPSVPVYDSYLGPITNENKYSSQAAYDYYVKYYYPAFAVYEVNYKNDAEGTKRKCFEIWARFVYGSSQAEQNSEFITGIMLGGMLCAPKTAYDIIQGTLSVIENPEQLAAALAFIAKASLPGEEQDALIMMINQSISEWMTQYNNADPVDKGFMIGMLVGQTLLTVIDGAGAAKEIKDFVASGRYLNVFRAVTQAVGKIKTAIMTSYDELGILITKFYSKIDGMLEVEYAGVGRMKFNEAKLIEGADITGQQRYKNFLEARWAESEGSLIDDAAETLMDGQQYTTNGRIKVLKSDITYTSNGYTYQTDSMGRISKASGRLQLNEAPRNDYAQRMSGRIDRRSTDQGGHLIASRFNGSGNLDNLVPMDANLNQGAWKAMEYTWANALNNGEEVIVDIQAVYTGVSQRPTNFIVEYYIDGERFVRNFDNVAGG